MECPDPTNSVSHDSTQVPRCPLLRDDFGIVLLWPEPSSHPNSLRLTKTPTCYIDQSEPHCQLSSFAPETMLLCPSSSTSSRFPPAPPVPSSQWSELPVLTLPKGELRSPFLTSDALPVTVSRKCLWDSKIRGKIWNGILRHECS